MKKNNYNLFIGSHIRCHFWSGVYTLPYQNLHGDIAVELYPNNAPLTVANLCVM